MLILCEASCRKSMKSRLTLMFRGLISIHRCRVLQKKNLCGLRGVFQIRGHAQSTHKANTVLLCARLQNEDGCVPCLKLVFKEVSRPSDYWFPNACVVLIKKYMQIGFLAGAHCCTVQLGTVCLLVSQVRRCIRRITRQTPRGRDAVFVAACQ